LLVTFVGTLKKNAEAPLSAKLEGALVVGTVVDMWAREARSNPVSDYPSNSAA